MLELLNEEVCVQESSAPRPHYRVTIKAVAQGHPDLVPGLLQDEVTMTVCLPLDIGANLETIKSAAARRFAVLATKMVDHPSDEGRDNAVASGRVSTRLKDSKVNHRTGNEQRCTDLVSETE